MKRYTTTYKMQLLFLAFVKFPNFIKTKLMRIKIEAAPLPC